MSFPSHDPNWTSVADFVDCHAQPGDRILAPDLFWRRFRKIFRYVNTRLDPAQTYDWVVVHEGEIDQLEHSFLHTLETLYRPLFANAVFVVLASGHALPD